MMEDGGRHLTSDAGAMVTLLAEERCFIFAFNAQYGGGSSVAGSGREGSRPTGLQRRLRLPPSLVALLTNLRARVYG